MSRTRRHLSSLLLALFPLVGCQGVQPDSTPDAPLEQTDMNAGAETDRESEVVLDLRLEALQESRPDIVLQARNPFGFRSGTSDVRSGQEVVSVPVSPEPVPPNSFDSAFVPRSHLRMIGLVEASETASRIAVLTDGDIVLHGREGDIVEGHYRIVNIAESSVEIESLEDGSRQVLRLAGS